MKEKIEENVIVYDDEVVMNEEGAIISHPLESLYYQPKNKNQKASNMNDLTFAGNHLFESNILNDIRLFEVIFRGEPVDEVWREAWANPLRADILKCLSGDNQSWYLSFVSQYTYQLFHNENREVPSEIAEYFKKKDPSQIIYIDSKPAFGYGNKLEKRLFFEVPNDEIDEVTRMIWSTSWEAYTIQGYNFTSGRIDLLKEWDKREKDDLLFKEIIKETQIIFHTWPEEHRHFRFFTNKLNLEEFLEIIHLEDLRQKAKRILGKQDRQSLL